MINKNKKVIDLAPLVKGGNRRGDYNTEMQDKNPTTANAVITPHPNPLLKLLHARRVSPKLLRNRRLNLLAIRTRFAPSVRNFALPQGARENKTTCHPELVSGSHVLEIPEQVRYDMKSGLPRFARNDEKTCHEMNLTSYRFNVLTSIKKVDRTNNKVAFTLAEVLITLGIIGIVAAMTLPSVINRYRDRHTVAAVKKVYSTMSQALMKTIAQEGEEWWDYDDFVNSGNDYVDNNPNIPDVERLTIKPLLKNLKLIKDCGRKADGCWPDVTIKRLNGVGDRNIERQTRYYKVILADGTMVGFSGEGKTGPSQGSNEFQIWVDINGKKAPNTLGKDVFMFQILGTKFLPFDYKTEGNIIDICSPFQTRDGASRGYACANWVLFQENLDYLYCDDLSWNGKHKCK